MISPSIRGGCSKVTRRSLSRGALAGGFTQEGLQNHAIRYWNEKQQEPYTDLFSQKLSAECTQWLDSHHDPSSELARAFFGSSRFAPERAIMSPFFYSRAHLPDSFEEKDQFLAWEVASKTPLELICSWELLGTKGLTMMAFDAKLRRLYHGNCVDSLTSKNGVGKALIPFHTHYAKFLLGGMADALEQRAILKQ